MSVEIKDLTEHSIKSTTYANGITRLDLKLFLPKVNSDNLKSALELFKRVKELEKELNSFISRGYVEKQG